MASPMFHDKPHKPRRQASTPGVRTHNVSPSPTPTGYIQPGHQPPFYAQDSSSQVNLHPASPLPFHQEPDGYTDPHSRDGGASSVTSGAQYDLVNDYYSGSHGAASPAHSPAIGAGVGDPLQSRNVDHAYNHPHPAAGDMAYQSSHGGYGGASAYDPPPSAHARPGFHHANSSATGAPYDDGASYKSSTHLAPYDAHAMEMSEVSIHNSGTDYAPPPSLGYGPGAGPGYPPTMGAFSDVPSPGAYYGGGGGVGAGRWKGGYQMPDPQMGYAPSAYSQARERIMRKRTVKHVELQQGNLVLDCPVPSNISKPAGTSGDESTHMRYTAVTCDPDDFVRKKYSLRQFLFGRQTELFIVLTMYNEDEILFVRTMNAVIKNIAHLQGRTRSKTWGPDSWKKVVVCVVSDGRQKINDRTLKVLGLMGCYQDGIAKDTVAGKDVQAHLFEYTTNVIVDDKGNISVGTCPVQVLFCLKEQNKKKLNSHRWFFNAFSPQLKPNVCVLIDVGTKPTGTSIYELWKAFDKDSHVGGACGEICVDTGRGCYLLINPLVASQNFEYKISNILDKPLESVFGYISVLPGAFSAYRYQALLNSHDGTGPLNSYFKGEAMHAPGAHTASLFESNMYLAEDRILCFEIVTKKRESWVLKYVKSAKASTDVPDRVPEFISQRRRWLNGSLFASIHATVFGYRIWTSGQGFFRKIWLQLQWLYNLVQLLFTFTAIGNFFLAFFFLVQSATQDTTHDPFWGEGTAVLEVVQNVYIALILILVICSLGNRPQGSNFAYTSAMLLFAVIMGLVLYCAGWTIYLAIVKAGLNHASGWTSSNMLTLLKTNSFRDIVIALAATYVLYLVSSLLHFEPWHMLTSFLQYLFLMPSYISVLGIYSMCNLHDVSWGTKGDNNAKDLGGAKTVNKDGKEVAVVEVLQQREDVDELWNKMRQELATPHKEEHKKRDAATKQEDHYRNYRTNVVLIWFAVNAALIIIFTSTWFNNYVRKTLYNNDPKAVIVSPYQTALFWGTAGLAAVRFFGSTVYLLLRIFGW